MLDDKRLGGQRTEAWAILKWLRAPEAYPKLVKAGYCLMWKGYEAATRYREPFRYAHFLKSAPTLLSDQLCTSAMRQAAALRGARSEKATLGA